ncbi:MAG: cytochrome P450 [Cyanobacteriota bacterium]|nr:cytochrome P450 [Cyanobacteriota bacterium]
MTVQKGPTTPRFLQLVQSISSPLTFMEKNAKRYGEVFEVDLTRKVLFFSSPKAIQEIFAANPRKFECGEANDILQPIVGNYSLLLLDGDRHGRHRSLLMPPFHQERMKAYGKLICDLTLEVTKKWIPGKPFIARNAARDISIEVILQAVFGLSEGKRYEELRQMLGQMLEALNSPCKSSMLFLKKLQIDLGPWSPWGKFVRRRQEIDKLLYAEISDRRASLDPEASDILTLMLLATDAEGQPLTDEECKDELLTLLFAGDETTATAIAWALYSIHKHPEVRAKLLAELATLGDNPEPMAIAKLPYLNAVCNETLRMYPVTIVTSPRTSKEPITIHAENYDGGTTLVPCIYLVHRREDLYPEPDKFKPERFLERKFSPYEFFPFGGGNRRCIGAALATMEMKLVLATILLNYNLALAEERPVRAIRRGVTLAPAGGVKMAMLSN